VRTRAVFSTMIVALAMFAGGCGNPGARDAALHPPKLVRLSDRGPSFLAYDGDPNLNPDRRDWPVSIVFAGRASITKVKRALRAVGLTHVGYTHYLPYRVGGASLRFDGDSGLKSGCDDHGSDLHIRLYAPTATDRFIDPQFGSFVVGTTHIDHADGCKVPPTLFGFSEEAEQRIATLLAKRGWRVQRNHLALGNREPYRREVADPVHIWHSNGRATLITVP
jgi:hypothetical protein